MSTLTKAVAGISTIGGVGGALVLGAYSFTNIQNIQSRLEIEGYEPLNTEKDENWEIILTSYKNAKSNTFEQGEKLKSETIAGLRVKCKNSLNKSSNTDQDYLLARQWCVKEKGIKDILRKLGLRELKTDPVTSGDSSVNPDDSLWGDKVTNYKKDNVKHKDIIISGEQSAVDKGKIQTACKKLISELKTTTDGFNDKLEQVKEWCSTGILKNK